MKRLATSLLLAVFLHGCATTGGPSLSSGSGVSGSPPPVAQDERARVYTQLAAGYYSRGQLAVALEDIRKAIAVEPSYAPAYSVLGLIHAELKEDFQAEENFRRALSLAPSYSEAHNNFGVYLCQRQKMKESLSHFEAALANPLYATPERALANAGACALDTGDVASAENYFTRSLKRDPRVFTANLGLAEVRYRQGHYLAARSLLNHTLSQAEPTPQGLWLAIRIEHKLGDRDAEAALVSNLRKRFPESIQVQWSATSQYDQNGSLL
jgi:type IV pilus assembly protein PilF